MNFSLPMNLTDIAQTSVEQCESRYKEMKERAQRERHNDEIFGAQFIAADCTKVLKPSILLIFLYGLM